VLQYAAISKPSSEACKRVHVYSAVPVQPTASWRRLVKLKGVRNEFYALKAFAVARVPVQRA
jgi:hypothetical protein